MTDRIRQNGTQPLRTPTNPLRQAPPPPPPPPRRPGAQPPRDEATARAGDVSPDARRVDLSNLQIPEAKVTGVEPKEEPKKEEGFFGRLWGSVKSVTHTVAEVARTTADVVGAGLHEVAESRRQGQGLIESLGDGLHAAGEKLYNDVIDPTLDHSVLGQDDEFQDKGAGALGPILTNRLAVGESVDIRIEAGATLPTEIIGAPNVKLDGGGTLSIKRVAALDANNQPIIGPDGQPETRLEVELKADGRVGGAYSASVGFSSTVQAGRYEAGVKAEANAEAEAGLTGSLSLKLRFNPDSPQEMGDLAAMMHATAATGAAATIPGVGAVFAATSGEAYQRSLSSLNSHLESFSGEGGLYAQASASAEAKVGIFKAEKEGGEEPEGAGPQTLRDQARQYAVDQAKGKAEEVEDGILEKLQLNLGSLSASLGGEVRVGASRNFRTGDRTISVTAQGAVQGEANVLGLGTGGKAEGSRKLDFVMGADGELKGINIQQKLTKEQFLAMRTTVEDIYGRPIDEGMIARMSESDTITVNYQVRPEVLADVKARIRSGEPAAFADAARTVLSAAMTADRFLVSQNGITSTHREELAIRGGFQLSLGAQVGVRAGVVLGHNQETVVR